MSSPEERLADLSRSVGDLARMPVAGDKYSRRERDRALAGLELAIQRELAQMGGGYKDQSSDPFRRASLLASPVRHSQESAQYGEVAKAIQADIVKLRNQTDSLPTDTAEAAFVERMTADSFNTADYPRPADLYGDDDNG
jgi:hypothetical protein